MFAFFRHRTTKRATSPNTQGGQGNRFAEKAHTKRKIGTNTAGQPKETQGQTNRKKNRRCVDSKNFHMGNALPNGRTTVKEKHQRRQLDQAKNGIRPQKTRRRQKGSIKREPHRHQKAT